ncbi:MAG: hypothetical protein ACE5G8_15735 [Anaerolineae bacterium]
MKPATPATPPPELPNQIDDRLAAVDLTRRAIAGEITPAEAVFCRRRLLAQLCRPRRHPRQSGRLRHSGRAARLQRPPPAGAGAACAVRMAVSPAPPADV